jgi:two-component system phosphate regulon response regulator PhoB
MSSGERPTSGAALDVSDAAVEPQKRAKVVVVTSDTTIGGTLEAALRGEGYEVRSGTEGRAGIALIRAEQPDLVLLDLVLPDLPGTEVCRTLRSDRLTRSMPILIVTSRADEMDRVVAFEIGVDDFVAAPFSVREVLLRVRVLLRPRPIARATAPLRVGALSLDSRSHRVWVDAAEVTLSVREFRLLEVLMTRADRVLPRDTLLDLVWGRADVGARSVDAYVTRLRKKLGAAREYVETVSSVGYRLKIPLGE